ncbi:MAG: Stp1/IreP family PP2C-type Ser/Thr phosphatase [Actinomycetia bacterium]|nr:Stp1/IreP family PP2C-type Ser/Thr phosphatase [Actinomycetes bacterium]MCP4087758.1 Stp1/IreP family PP2C-type Ser/Thr phosphatase [Actinomycetes bacterium]
MISLRAGMVSDTGRVRAINQDSLLVLEHLAVVADGMGGHRGGEVASQVAVDSMAEAWMGSSAEGLVENVRTANRRVIERADAEPELRGMGTTLVAVGLVGNADGPPTVAVANVGDSRVYLLVDDGLEQLTVDHSLVEGLVRSGRITRDEALVHPQRSIVTRALGIDTSVDVDLLERPARVGDRFLLCSDGLSNEVPQSLMASILQRFAEPAEAAAELVRVANKRGGRDNITCIVADLVVEADDAEARASAVVPDAAGFEAAGPDTIEYSLVDGPRDEIPDDEDDPARSGPFGRALGTAQASTDEYQPPRLTWRSLAFTGALLVVALVAIGGTGWYARSGWFVGVHGDQVALFQGRPGGVLWIDPTVERTSRIHYNDLTPDEQERVADEQEFSSREEAEDFLDSLCDTDDRCDP